jgi:orotidine-5'-phosphate decarboxylase
MIANTPRVFVALDFDNPMHALGFADRVDPRTCGLKVGKELYVLAGPEPVRWMVERGFSVFLDLKFHDIPNTVARACAAAVRLGVRMMNVHASGGREMLAAAREAVTTAAHATGRPAPLLLGVTVLTSLGDAQLRELGHGESAAERVMRLAQLARDCGLDGVVCSAQEAPALRQAFGASFALVTPGIRLADAARDDQTRIVTPEAAVANGADYIVVGRPVTRAADPVATLAAINRSIGAAA